MDAAELLAALTARGAHLNGTRVDIAKSLLCNDVAAAMAGMHDGPHTLLLCKYAGDDSRFWPCLKVLREETHIKYVLPCVMALQLHIDPMICTACDGAGSIDTRPCLDCDATGYAQIDEPELAKRARVTRRLWVKRYHRPYTQALAMLQSWETSGLIHLRNSLS